MRKALAQPHTKQFLKFAVVGLISFGIDWGMLIALVELFHLDFLMSTTVSFTTSVVVNYWLSMKYVFDHREGMSRKREFTIFTILSVIGLGLNILIANTSGFIISLIFNYLASMKYVFAHKEGMSRRREFIIFVVLSVIGLALNDGIVLTLNAGLGLEANIAKICATALVMVYNFVTRKIFLEGDETK